MWKGLYCLSHLHTNMNKGINLPSTQFLVPENKVKCNKFLFLLFNKNQEKCLMKFLTHFGP